MLENVIEPIPDGKIYPLKGLSIATVFATLIAGAYMLAHNYKVFGNRRAARITWVVSILSLLLSMVVELMSGANKTAPIFIAAISALGVNFFGRKFQLAKMQHHIGRGGEEFSTGSVVAVVIVVGAIFIGLTYLPAFILGYFYGY
jgi:lysylphosphatidylglycerol synthetase-like protein (DUF2156 family)